MTRLRRFPRFLVIAVAAATVAVLAILGLPLADDKTDAKQLKKAELLVELPDSCNTPDGTTLLPDESILLSVPNFNDKKAPPLLMRITKENKPEEFYKLPGHPEDLRGRFRGQRRADLRGARFQRAGLDTIVPHELLAKPCPRRLS